VANLTGEVASLPDIAEIESGIDARLVIEFYSK
jgi:ribosomal protein S4